MSQRPPRTRAEAKAARRGAAAPAALAATASGAGGAGRAASPRRKRWSWRRRIIVTLLTLGVLGIAGVLTAYALIRVPQPNDIATAQTSIIYYSDGKTELARISDFDGTRESVTIDQIPKHVQQAMVAAEDRTFYENEGISPQGIARAAWDTLKGSSTAGGGSTITQQYVKNYFLSQDRSFVRKGREMLISIKIEQQQTKDEILANYLNTIFFGRGSYGIQTASRAYFNKDVSDLTVSEAAVLASVIRAPSAYDPGLGGDALASAKKRFGYVIDGMVTMGYLTPEQAAQQKFPKVASYKPRAQTGPTGYLTQMVRNELITKYKIEESQVGRLGLRVVSTIDVKAQKAAVAAMKEQMPTSAPDILGGLASIQPGDGAIRALYGGSDYAKRQLNSATQARLQAGSTFKTFTLIAALQSGDVSLRSTFSGASPMFFKEFVDPSSTDDVIRRGGVRNAGNSSYGRLTVRQATASSVNTVFAQMNIIATPEATVRAAKTAGITTDVAANYGNVLGTDYTTVLDMASAYATIAAQGRYAVPYIVASVSTPDGALDVTAKPDTRDAFAADIMADTTYALEAPIEFGTATVARGLGRPAAGKTGTTLSSRSAWFAGFTPQLSTAVGLYRPGPDGEELAMKDLPGIGTISGGSYPTAVWTAYMRAALEGVEVVNLPPPANVNPGALPPAPAPPSRTAEPSPSPSESPSKSPSPSETPSPSPTPTPSDTPSAEPSPSPTEPTPSSTPSPSASTSPSPSPTP